MSMVRARGAATTQRVQKAGACSSTREPNLSAAAF